MSDSSPRSNRGVPAALLLFLAAALLSGCPRTADRPALDNAAETLLAAKGDEALGKAVRDGGKEKFAVIAVFRQDVFYGLSSMFDRSSFTMLNEFGNTAILLLLPGEVVPLMRDPSVVRLAWFGPQGRLARLEPSLEFQMLDRFGKGAEGREIPILARFRSVPKETEEKQVEAAGYKILSRVGPNMILSGPVSGIPKLLAIDWVIYLEKGTGL